MVSIVGATLAASFGFMLYLVLAVGGQSLPVELRNRIADFYFGLGMRSYRQVALVRRVIGKYELKPIKLNDAEGSAELTLNSGLIGDDKKLPFKNPDDRIYRLYGKPLALVAENVPFAGDAELAEIGGALGEKAQQQSITWESGDTHHADPYVQLETSLKAVDPANIANLIPNGVQPQNIKTTKQMTKKRYEKYSDRVGAKEALAAGMSFLMGAAGVVVIKYVQSKLIDESGGGGPPADQVPLTLYDIGSVAVDAVVIGL
jgi:hypothetical protein